MARRVTTNGASSSSLRDAKLSSSASSKTSEDEAEEITRCICGSQEFVQTARTKTMHAIPGLYVQCERCNVWQHGFCMGFLVEEDIPNEYYCEQCEPTFHRISHRHGVLMSKYRPHQPKHSASSSHTESASPPSSAAGDVSKPDPDEPPPKKEAPKKEESSRRSSRHSPPGVGSTTKKHDDTAGEPSIENDDAPANGQSRAQPDDDKRSAERFADGASNGQQLEASNLAGDPEHEEIPAESDHHPEHEAGPLSSAAASTPDGKLPADLATVKEEPQSRDSRKRRSRQPSESEIAYMRNRKRRSREDEILQRVLEESAREAREAESRRRSKEGLPEIENESAVKDDTPEFSNDHNEDDASGNTSDGVSAPVSSSRSRRSRRGAPVSRFGEQEPAEPEDVAAEAPVEPKRRDGVRNGVGRPTSSRNGDTAGATPSSARRPGGRASRAAAVANGNGNGSQASSSSRRTNNSGGSTPRRSKPRVPSQRSTFEEMRRRVSSILEFSSRTQDELIDDQKTRIVALQPRDMDSEEGSKYEQLLSMSQSNLSYLEDLTSKVLKWEEQFGLSGSP